LPKNYFAISVTKEEKNMGFIDTLSNLLENFTATNLSTKAQEVLTTRNIVIGVVVLLAVKGLRAFRSNRRLQAEKAAAPNADEIDTLQVIQHKPAVQTKTQNTQTDNSASRPVTPVPNGKTFAQLVHKREANEAKLEGSVTVKPVEPKAELEGSVTVKPVEPKAEPARVGTPPGVVTAVKELVYPPTIQNPAAPSTPPKRTLSKTNKAPKTPDTQPQKARVTRSQSGTPKAPKIAKTLDTQPQLEAMVTRSQSGTPKAPKTPKTPEIQSQMEPRITRQSGKVTPVLIYRHTTSNSAAASTPAKRTDRETNKTPKTPKTPDIQSQTEPTRITRSQSQQPRRSLRG